MEVIQNRKPTEKNEKDERNKRSPLNVTHENSPEANPQATPKPGHWGTAGGWSLKKGPLEKEKHPQTHHFLRFPILVFGGVVSSACPTFYRPSSVFCWVAQVTIPTNN